MELFEGYNMFSRDFLDEYRMTHEKNGRYGSFFMLLYSNEHKEQMKQFLTDYGRSINRLLGREIQLFTYYPPEARETMDKWMIESLRECVDEYSDALQFEKEQISIMEQLLDNYHLESPGIVIVNGDDDREDQQAYIKRCVGPMLKHEDWEKGLFDYLKKVASSLRVYYDDFGNLAEECSLSVHLDSPSLERILEASSPLADCLDAFKTKYYNVHPFRRITTNDLADAIPVSPRTFQRRLREGKWDSKREAINIAKRLQLNLDETNKLLCCGGLAPLSNLFDRDLIDELEHNLQR